MIPRNIDLTVNRDFGRAGEGNFISLPLAVRDGELMSSDEYEELCKYESVFGKRVRNQAREVLGDLYDLPQKDKEFEMWRQTCLRCGKRLFPWDNIGGICKDCDNEITQSYGFWNIPWLSENTFDTPRDTHSVMDIFDLR